MPTSQIRAYLAPLDPSASVLKAQRATVERYLTDHGGDPSVVLWYSDKSSSVGMDVAERVAGHRLMADVQKGDRVIVPRLDALASSLSGFAHTIDLLLNLGAIIHILDASMILSPEDARGRTFIRLMSGIDAAVRRATGSQSRRNHALLAAEGKRRSGHPPYGYRWRRLNGEYLVVENPDEQRVIEIVNSLRREGFSVDQIRRTLAYELKLRNRNGKEFHPNSIFRMLARRPQTSPLTSSATSGCAE